MKPETVAKWINRLLNCALLLMFSMILITICYYKFTPSDKADCSDLTAVIKPEEKETFKLYRETSTGKLYLSTPKGSNSGVIMGNILPIIDVETIDNYDCSQITYIAIDEKGNLYRKEDVKLMPAEINHTDTPDMKSITVGDLSDGSNSWGCPYCGYECKSNEGWEGLCYRCPSCKKLFVVEEKPVNHTDTPEPVCKSLPTENDFLFQCPWCEKWANWQATVYNGQLCPHCNKQCTFRAYAGNWNILKAEGNK